MRDEIEDVVVQIKRLLSACNMSPIEADTLEQIRIDLSKDRLTSAIASLSKAATRLRKLRTLLSMIPEEHLPALQDTLYKLPHVPNSARVVRLSIEGEEIHETGCDLKIGDSVNCGNQFEP